MEGSGSDYLGSIPSPPANNLFPAVPICNSPPYRAGGSSSGRTPVFGAGYLGSIPSPPATFFRPPRSLLQRRKIDDEPKSHIPLDHSLVGFVHLLDRNDFNIGFDAVRGTEIEHLLGFSDTADHRPSNAAAMQNEREGLQWRRLIRSPDENHGPVGLQ
jgi:hypothetical protein